MLAPEIESYLEVESWELFDKLGREVKVGSRKLQREKLEVRSGNWKNFIVRS